MSLRGGGAVCIVRVTEIWAMPQGGTGVSCLSTSCAVVVLTGLLSVSVSCLSDCISFSSSLIACRLEFLWKKPFLIPRYHLDMVMLDTPVAKP